MDRGPWDGYRETGGGASPVGHPCGRAATAAVRLSLAGISPHRISRAAKSRCTASPRITQLLAWASRVVLTGTALELSGMPHLPVASREASKTKPPLSVRGVPTDPTTALRIDSHEQKYVTTARSPLAIPATSRARALAHLQCRERQAGGQDPLR